MFSYGSICIIAGKLGHKYPYFTRRNTCFFTRKILKWVNIAYLASKKYVVFLKHFLLNLYKFHFSGEKWTSFGYKLGNSELEFAKVLNPK